jgi:hypothetical protein
MEANFGDVRFVASDNETVLNYWMTNEVASTSATFWVEVPTIPATGGTTIYMYYGNSSAVTTSNIHTTFIFGDDFADPTYTAAHINPFIGGASVQGIVIASDGSEYEMSGDNTKTDNDNRSEPIAQISNTDGSLMQFPQNYIAEDDVESFLANGNVFFNARYLDVNWKYEQLLDFEFHQVVENKVVNGAWTELGSAYIGPTTPIINTWYDFKAKVSAGTSGGTVLQTFVNGVQEIPNITDSSLSYNGLAFLTFSVDGPFHAAYRDVRVRAYAAVEPSVSLGAPGPAVTAISPTSGPAAGGTLVTITGTNFTGATAVQFGNTNASSFTVVSATDITATSPAGTAIVDVTIITPSGTSAISSADKFTYSTPAPTISSFTPSSGNVGTLVTITGTNFNVVTAVNFGGIASTAYTIISGTSITAAVPAGGTGTISVTTPGGTATSASSFAVIPTVTAISPTSGPTAGGISVTITGTGFATSGTVTVTIGNNAATNVSVTNSTTITAMTPAGTAGLRDVVVTNPNSQVGTLKGGFTYTAAVPAVITDLVIPGVTAPATGGTPMTVTGTDTQFTGAVSWSPTGSPFAGSTVYTATITLTPKTGYTLTGVAANSFAVAGATATNAAGSGVVTAVFPATITSGGGGVVGGTPVVTGITDITSYINAKGAFTQNINVWSDDTDALIQIPSGTTVLLANGTVPTQISAIHMATPPVFQTGAGIIGLAYDFLPAGITFSPAVTLRFSYNPGFLPTGILENNLQIAYFDTTQNAWITVPATVDTVNHYISAQISHFTAYAVTYGVKPVTPVVTTTTSTTTTTTTPVIITTTTTPLATTTTTTGITTTAPESTTTTAIAQLTTTTSAAATTPITTASNTTATGTKTSSSLPVWIFIIIGVVVILIVIVVVITMRRRTN